MSQADEAHRREEDETRRRLAEEMERWQRHVLDAARKEALERDIAKKRAMREKVLGHNDPPSESASKQASKHHRVLE